MQDKKATPSTPGQPVAIAVTGTAASGKSLVSDRFRQLGLKTIDLDRLAREVVEPGSPAFRKIVDRFGRRMLKKDGRIDRRQLRRRIITDHKAKQDLEAMVHPEIRKRMQQKLKGLNPVRTPFVVVEVPLLFETGLQSEFDVVVLVTANRETQINRLVYRDGMPIESAESLLDIQMPDEQKVERSDYVLINTGTMEEVIDAVDRTYEQLVQKYGKKPKSLDNPQFLS